MDMETYLGHNILALKNRRSRKLPFRASWKEFFPEFREMSRG